MKIRKITDYTEEGVIEEKFNLIIEEKEEAWELDIIEMTTLRELMNTALGTEPIKYIPDQSTKYFNKWVAPLPLREEMEEPLEEPIERIEEQPGQWSPTSLTLEENEPVVSKSMGAGLIEKESEIESYENLTKSEDKSKERNKPGRKTNRNFSKYIGMFVDGTSKREIVQEMIEDWAVTESTANNYYFAKVKPVGEVKQAEKQGRANEKEKKVLLKGLESKIISKKIDPELFEVVDSLPNYSTPQQFKDACAVADIGRGRYSITAIKDIYLDTHPEVRW